MQEYLQNKREKMNNHIDRCYLDMGSKTKRLEQLEDEDFFDMFTKNEKCKNCIEPCCLRNPCCYVPDDFWSMDKDYLEYLLELNLLCIDYYYNYSYSLESYYIRPRGYSDKDEYSDYNPCIFYKEDRCIFDKYERPIQPLLFISNQGGCFPIYTINQIVEDYKPYQEILKELYKKYSASKMKDKHIEDEKIKTLVKRIIEKPLQN